MTLLGTLFGFEGRIGRSTFWLCGLAVALLDIALWLIAGDWIQQTYPEAAALATPGGQGYWPSACRWWSSRSSPSGPGWP